MSGPLDPRTLAFLQSTDVSAYVASSDARRRPHAARAFTCRPVGAEGRLKTWVHASAAAAVLEDIGGNARLAFTASDVGTCQSLQLKSADARVVPAASADYPLLLAYQEAFVAKTTALGYPEGVMRNVVRLRLDDLVAIEFTPAALFLQTPGPRAGERVRETAA